MSLVRKRPRGGHAANPLPLLRGDPRPGEGLARVGASRRREGRVVAYRSELIGGKSVPDVVGWNAERAASRLESDGFSSTTVVSPTAGEAVGTVTKQDPAAGARVEPGSMVTLSVAGGATTTAS